MVMELNRYPVHVTVYVHSPVDNIQKRIGQQICMRDMSLTCNIPKFIAERLTHNCYEVEVVFTYRNLKQTFWTKASPNEEDVSNLVQGALHQLDRVSRHPNDWFGTQDEAEDIEFEESEEGEEESEDIEDEESEEGEEEPDDTKDEESEPEVEHRAVRFWSSGNLPIHLAARHKASAAVVKLLLQEDAAAVRVVNIDNQLPLHLAIQHGASAEVVKLLLEADRRPPGQPLRSMGKNKRIRRAE